jgi:hypothetical protein
MWWIVDLILEKCKREKEKEIQYVEKDLNLENVIKFLEDLKQFRK